MSAAAHVTFIHGISNKVAADALLRSWLDALADQGGPNLRAQGVSTSMVYWADVLYEAPLTEAMTGSLLENMSGDSPLANELLDWESRLSPQERFFVESLRSKMEPIAQATEPGELGSAVERVPLPWFVKRPLMERLLRDVHHYLFNVRHSPRSGVTYQVQDEIRRRFVTSLQRVSNQPHVVVAHSMGTVIAYDCLARVRNCPAISALLTIGSPLGLDEIQDKLQPEWTRHNGFPSRTVGAWINVFDHLDPVAGFDPYLANDFLRAGQRVIQDIHEPNSGQWRHDIQKYLRGRKLREALRGVLQTSAPAAQARVPFSSRAERPAPRSPNREITMPSEKIDQLARFIRQIAPADAVVNRRRLSSASSYEAMESFAAPALGVTFEAAQRGVEKLALGQEPTPVEATSIEAIILPRERPVVFVERNSFDVPESPWEHFADDRIRPRLEAAIPSIGRVELPKNLSIPYG